MGGEKHASGPAYLAYSSHDLRRSAVRNMTRAGIPRPVAMAITGHKTESMYKRYDIVSGQDLSNVGEQMERFMRQQKAPAKLERVKHFPIQE